LDLVGMTEAAFEREGISMTCGSLSKCHHTPEESQFVQTLLGIYGEYTGETGRCIVMGGQTYVHDIPGGVAFGCAIQGEDNGVHGANEHVGVEQILLSAKMFTQTIIDMCKHPL
jgi:succinyl-diaminopimelate desuccinylase